MPQIPAFCDNCHLIFGSGFNLGNSKGITLTNTVVTCPRCHHFGKVLDGVYDGLRETIQALLKMSVDDLKVLLHSLEDAKRDVRIDGNMAAFSLLSFAHLTVKKDPKNRLVLITLLCVIIQTLIQGYNAFHQKAITPEQAEVMIHKAGS